MLMTPKSHATGGGSHLNNSPAGPPRPPQGRDDETRIEEPVPADADSGLLQTIIAYRLKTA